MRVKIESRSRDHPMGFSRELIFSLKGPNHFLSRFATFFRAERLAINFERKRKLQHPITHVFSNDQNRIRIDNPS